MSGINRKQPHSRCAVAVRASLQGARRTAWQLGVGALLLGAVVAQAQAQQVTTCPGGAALYRIGTGLSDTATTKALNATNWPNSETSRTFTWSNGVTATLSYSSLSHLNTTNAPWPRIANLGISGYRAAPLLQVYHNRPSDWNGNLSTFDIQVNYLTSKMSVEAVDLDAPYTSLGYSYQERLVAAGASGITTGSTSTYYSISGNTVLALSPNTVSTCRTASGNAATSCSVFPQWDVTAANTSRQVVYGIQTSMGTGNNTLG